MRTINYIEDDRQIGDLLREEGIDLKNDFTAEERENLIRRIADYLVDENDSPIVVELHELALQLDGRAANDLMTYLQ